MERLRLISAVGDESMNAVRNLSNALKNAGIPYLSVSNEECVFDSGGRPNDGYAIDGFGDAGWKTVQADKTPVILTATDRIPRFAGFGEGVLIIGSQTELPENTSFPQRLYIIINSGSGVKLPFMKRYPVISCGMNGKDSVTYSSTDGRSAVVCIQRQITTFAGRVIETCEHPVAFCGGGFGTLAAFAAMAVCDWLDI